MRGARPRRCPAPSRSGIIPACAGSTVMRSDAFGFMRDHPRMCGEHCHWLSVEVTPLGSSPHVRGARRLWSVFGSVTGIIPACAGSTLIGGTIPSQWRDHPRMCGEHQFVDGFPGGQKGSSPHVRGAPLLDLIVRAFRGIIPACAGSTWRRLCWFLSPRDHPRMCGEHTSKIA